MVWSVSTAKIFDRCQRQWFYKQHFANARSKSLSGHFRPDYKVF